MRKRRILADILDELKTHREISKRNWFKLKKLFGERFEKAWRLVSEGRIKRYIFNPSGRVLWVAIGQVGEYLIYPYAGYCGCNNFYFKVVDGEEAFCYHLLGQKIAEALKVYEEVREEDEAYQILMGVWKKEIQRE
jgi:predicted nucleic acid-binding Zn finger protein